MVYLTTLSVGKIVILTGVLFYRFPEGTDESHKEHHSRQPVFRLGFMPSTVQISSTSAIDHQSIQLNLLVFMICET
jgi:hypothetical protein